LAFGCTSDTYAIDVWSAGCVIAEMFLGEPLFFSESSVEHLVAVISVLGTPTNEDLQHLNPQLHTNVRLPDVPPRRWSKVLPKADPLLLDLLSKILVFNPELRL
jgi:glycogen synthase kinase 3 beta